MDPKKELPGIIERLELLEQRRVKTQDIQPNAVQQNHIEASIIFSGKVVDRPSNGDTEIQVYFATDENILYLWNATDEAWVGYARIPASPATYTPTNVTTDRTYDADSTTTAELADVLGSVIADLQSIGLIK